MSNTLVAKSPLTTDDNSLINRYAAIRNQTEVLCQPLAIEDYGLQTAAFASPVKWHLAHTAWFFETMVLIPYLKDYREFHAGYDQLFNSYYDTIGNHHPRAERGLLSRPLVDEVYQYRRHVDEHMQQLLQDDKHVSYQEIQRRSILGLNHEQQHQELMLTDIKYNFGYHPMKPVYSELPESPIVVQQPVKWIDFSGGLYTIGFTGEGFSYDNEMPHHTLYTQGYRLASRPVNNGEYIDFITDGGYRNSDLWLSDAWTVIQQQNWQAPLYWQKIEDQWFYFTLGGMRAIDLAAPVTHVSFFETAAYARWADKRLPTEAEWEIAATQQPKMNKGNFVEDGFLQPAGPQCNAPLQQLFGDVWEWTQSPYTPYPGYRQQHGPLGEYNGKFMSSQIVLRGGSCVTPADHIRSTYRNFFYPQERWQFSGFRLAEDQ